MKAPAVDPGGGVPGDPQRSSGAPDQLTIANEVDELHRVAAWLEQATAHFDWSPRTAFKLDLMLNEALPNIIHYAYTDQEPHHIHLRVEDRLEQVTLEICDDGIAFDPFAQHRCADDSSLETAAPGGRGIPLMVALSDAREYQRIGQINRLRVVLGQDETGDRQYP